MPYVLLGIAIGFELVGTTLLKTSAGFTKLWPSLGCIAAYVICFWAFSRALLNINLSVGYATWSAVGIIVSSLLSVFLFKETMTVWGVLGIVLVVTGVLLLNLYGTK